MANEQSLSPQGYNINEAPYNTNPSTWEGGGSGGGGDSLPEGGTTGQVLTKRSNNDGDADWQNVPQELPPYPSFPLERRIPHILTANEIDGAVNKEWLLPMFLKLSQNSMGSDYPEGMLLQSDGNGGFNWRDKEIPNGGTAGQVLVKYGDGDGEANWQNIPSEGKSLEWVDTDSYPDLGSPISSYNAILRTISELQAWKPDEYEVALPYANMLIDGETGNTVTDDQSGSTISVEIVPVTSPYEIWDDQTETMKKYGLMKQDSRISFGIGSLGLSEEETFLSVRGKSNDNIEITSIDIANTNIYTGGNGYSITGTCTLYYFDAEGTGYDKQFTLEISSYIGATTERKYKKLIAM